MKLQHVQESFYKTFEQEFGRVLSSFEVQQLLDWCTQYREELILQALYEAVISNKRNMRYIDRILFNWEKLGIRTKHEAIEYSKKFRERAFKDTVQAADEDRKVVDQSIFYNWLEE